MHETNGATPILTRIISWTFFIIFVGIGLLNLLLVHLVPGVFYLILSVLYFPQLESVMKQRFGFSISLYIKVVVGLFFLWGTLAVGDLAELLGL